MGADSSIDESIRPYLISKYDKSIDCLSFSRAWLDNSSLFIEVSELLHLYYQDISDDINPIMLGIICSQAEQMSISSFYHLYKRSEVWNIPHSLLLNHLIPKEPVDLIGFYIWLARYKSTGASAPIVLKEMWKPFDMDVEDFPILTVLEEQGLYMPYIKHRKVMYRWTDRSMPNRLLSIGQILLTHYRMRSLLQNVKSIPFYRYHFLPPSKR